MYAVDVGATQLDWKLRTDPRVVVQDHTNARHLHARHDLPELCDIAVCDVSFISVTLILPPLPPLLTADWRDGCSGQAAVRSRPRTTWARAASCAIQRCIRPPATKCGQQLEALGYRTEIIDSPITGAEGNQGVSAACRTVKTVGISVETRISLGRTRSFRRLFEWLSAARHRRTLSTSRPAVYLDLPGDGLRSAMKFRTDCDLVIVLGGDGTLLSAARAHRGPRDPAVSRESWAAWDF